MKEKRKVIYYSDELNDEFSLTQITTRKIDAAYDYDGKPFTRCLARLIIYRIIAIPLAALFLKIKFGHKIENKNIIKEFYKKHKKGFFIYGNHTNDMADAYIPTMITLPRAAYVIVHANNVSIPIMGKFTPYLGAIPLPDDFTAARNFNQSIKKKIEKKCAIIIYPEAHIWPYYTKIRSFSDTSFRYPVQYNVPVFAFTNVYQKRRFRKLPKMITYIDGPFFLDKTLTVKEQKKILRDNVYAAMCERSKLNNVEYIRYEKKV
ncbi:MAG: hypothetical protein GX220_06775 [Treponema sp.]|nr:hypothetical protein [Treponema sp.]